MDKQIKKNIFLELIDEITIFMIILFILQILFEEFSVFAGYDISIVKNIKLFAFFFDLFFSFDFIIRSIILIKNKEWKEYFFYQSGWIDFISSIPALLLISIPEFFYQINHTNIISLFLFSNAQAIKLIRTIKIIRIFRIIRMLKILKNEKDITFAMSKRHIIKISTIVITGIIIFYSAISLLEENKVFPSKINKTVKEENNKIKNIFLLYKTVSMDNFKDILTESPIDDVVEIKYNNLPVYSSKNYFSEKFLYYLRNPFIYGYTETYEIKNSFDKLNITFSRDKIYKEEALINMEILILIIFIFFILVLFYLKHFSKTIALPINIMRKGFEEKNYIYAVKIPKHYSKDDVFKLSEDFNSKWLPAKIRKLNELNNSEGSKLSIDDIFKNN